MVCAYLVILKDMESSLKATTWQLEQQEGDVGIANTVLARLLPRARIYRPNTPFGRGTMVEGFAQVTCEVL